MKNWSDKNIQLIVFYSAFIFSVGFYNFLHFEFLDISSFKIDEVKTENCIKTNVCEIQDFPDKFENKQVNTKATLYAYTFENRIILYPIVLGEDGCSVKTDNFFDSTAVVEFKNYRGENYELKSILENEKPFAKEIDVEINGFIEIDRQSDGHKIIKLIPDRITKISKFKEFTPKAAA